MKFLKFALALSSILPCLPNGFIGFTSAQSAEVRLSGAQGSNGTGSFSHVYTNNPSSSLSVSVDSSSNWLSSSTNEQTEGEGLPEYTHRWYRIGRSRAVPVVSLVAVFSVIAALSFIIVFCFQHFKNTYNTRVAYIMRRLADDPEEGPSWRCYVRSMFIICCIGLHRRESPSHIVTPMHIRSLGRADAFPSPFARFCSTFLDSYRWQNGIWVYRMLPFNEGFLGSSMSYKGTRQFQKHWLTLTFVS